MKHVRFLSAVFSLAACVSTTACGGGSSSNTDDGGPVGGHDAGPQTGTDAGRRTTPPRACRPGSEWSPGTAAFTERTADWGLAGETAVFFGTGDLDNDGFDDIVTMTLAYVRNNAKVFMNRPNGSGGRAFVDETEASKLFAVRDSDELGRNTQIVTFGDVDNDGDLDAYANTVYTPSDGFPALPERAEILLNDGHGHFAITGAEPVPGPSQPQTSGAFFFDHNLDGKLDLFVGYWWQYPPFSAPYGQQPRLHRGDGTGGFMDVTDAAGLRLRTTNASIIDGTSVRPLFGATMCDVNNDGRMDIVGAAYGRFYNELFLADGDRFSEQARAYGVAADDRLDYTTDTSYRCYCLSHAGDPYCAGAQAPFPRSICTAFGGTAGRGWNPGSSDQAYNLGGNTFSYACGDFDNDGDFDLYESNIKHPDTGTASDPSEVLVNQTIPGAFPAAGGMGGGPPGGGGVDAGGPSADDAGSELADAGTTTSEDAGAMMSAMDAGAMMSEMDAGVPGMDAGIPASDAGIALSDAGSDAGVMRTGSYFTRPGRELMGLTPPVDLTRIDEGGQNNSQMDFDNDGRLDLYLGGSPYPGNKAWLFHQRRTGTLQFEWIGAMGGFSHACPHGIALADFDHDGDEDVIVGTYGCNDPNNNPDYRPPENQPVRVYENVSNENNWISIQLRGRGGEGGSNGTGLGALVRVTAGGVTQSRLIHNSAGRGAMSRSPVAFFGLGSACDIERIEVRWPNAALTTTTYTGVVANNRVLIVEGQSDVEYLW